MAKFNPIKFDHTGPVSFEDINRLQDALAIAFTAIEPSQLQIHSVTGQYKASEHDQILIADPQAGPVKVIVQIPAIRQQITVMNGSGTSKNTVQIVRMDGKAFGESGAVLDVPNLKTVTVACSGKDWFRLVSA